MAPDATSPEPRLERRRDAADARLPRLTSLPGDLDDALARDALEIGQVGVWAWNLDTDTVVLDPVARRIWNLPPGAPVALSRLVEAIHPRDLAAVRRAVLATRETGAECQAVFRVIGGDGPVRWMRIRGRLRRTLAGQRIVGVTIDITERKRTEAALSATEERLRRAQELGGALPFEWDAASDELVAGDAFRALYGLPPDAPFRMETFLALVHPDDRDRVEADHARLLAAPGPYESEFRVVLPDGTERWILSRGETVSGPGGAPAGVAGINMDVTARKRIEGELRRSKREVRARFREIKALYQNAPVGLALLDPSLRFQRVNEFMAGLDGLPVDDHLDRGFFEVLPQLRGPLKGVMLSLAQPVRNVEVEAPGADGSERVWRFHFHPLRDEGGAVIGIGLVAEDVTEPRRVERSRDLLSRELSHRIKNLFAVVSSLISLSARGQEGVQDFARTVRGRVDALGRAHDCVRPAEWGSRTAGEAPTLHQLLRTLLSPYAEGPDRVRIAGEDLPISGQCATALALAFHEFATNAAKYGALSAEAGRVEIASSVEGDAVEIAWRESGGPPIPAPPTVEGFGSTLARRSLGGDLGATLVTRWAREGLEIRIRVPRERLER